MSDLTQQLDVLSKAGVYLSLEKLLGTRHWARDIQLFSRQAARSLLLGETRSRFRGRGMEFEEVRRYQAGDDIRTIDWRVSARTGKTHTKLFCEERERPVHILVDQRSALFFGSSRQFKSVLAGQLAAGIAWAALAGSDRIGGQIVGDEVERTIRAKRNKQAVLRFLHDLSELNQLLPTQHPHNTLANSLEECRRITRPGTAIFIISDFHDFDQACAKALSNLGRHCDIYTLQITDPIELNLPMNSRGAISNGTAQTPVMFSKKLHQAYQQERHAHQQHLQKALLSARAFASELSTQESAQSSLQKIFGK